jgi:flagellar FliL protein
MSGGHTEAAAAADAGPAPIAVKGMGLVKLVPVLLLFTLANMGGTGFLIHKAMHPAPLEVVENHPKPEKTEHGPTVAFEAFVVNLNEPGSSRYLKTTLEVEVDEAKDVDVVTAAKGVIRDEVLRYLSGLSVAQTLGEDNKAKIVNEVKERISRVVGERRIVRVLINEFVVQ